VPQSQILLFPRYGIDLVVAHPPEFPLDKGIVQRASEHAADAGTELTFVHDMDEAVKDADVIFPKNWGGFAHFDPFEDSEATWDAMKANLEKHRGWILDRERFSLAKRDAKIMHALPADRNNEVTDEVLDSPNSIIYDEAENRLHTAKGVLNMLVGGAA
jgi:ornithine carbamoyltransferase